MTRLKTLSLVAFLSFSLLAAGSTAVRADDDHSKLHRKLEKKHERYHRKHEGPPYGRAYGHHRHTPTCGHTVNRAPAYGGSYGRVDAACGPILARAQKARDGLARWEGTGRHRDAVRAWHKILQRTPQRLAECRREAHARAARGYDDRYGGYYDDYDTGYGDPYASSTYPYGESFELKRDWPVLLGGLLGQYSNR